MASLTAKKRAERALAGKALRSAACAVLVLMIAAAESTGCGSKSDLVIGRNASGGGPDASSRGGTGGGNATGGELRDAAAEAAPDAGPDAPPDAPPPDAAPDSAPLDCSEAGTAPPTSLLHRYSFDGTGTVAKDSVGTADGEVKPGAALGSGLVTLDGLNGYVNLPNHLISVLNEVTFVVWLKWLGGAGYERIFDFGVGAGEDNTTGQGQSYVATSPFGGTAQLQMLVRQNGTQPELPITTQVAMDDGFEHQVAAVFVNNSYAELYRDGQLLGRIPIPFALSEVDDVNDWIGRSQWTGDHTFNGTVNEFRIYGQALSACAIAALNQAGPNAL